MSAIKVMKAKNPDEMARLLNGIITSKRNLSVGRDPGPNPPVPSGSTKNLYAHPVGGLTLIFTAPAVTVTFVGSRTMLQIVSDINTALGGTYAYLYRMGDNGEQMLALWNDATPVVLSHTGTANTYFGFSTVSGDPDLTQTPVPAANIKSMLIDLQSRQYVTFYT